MYNKIIVLLIIIMIIDIWIINVYKRERYCVNFIRYWFIFLKCICIIVNLKGFVVFDFNI